VRWSVDGRDWARPGASRIAQHYLERARPGAIFLLHDGGGKDRRQTVEALEAILTVLERRGYRFVTVSQLLQMALPASAATSR